MSLARLYALVYFGYRYHSGQFSRGYRLLCYASARLQKMGITNAIDQWDKTTESGFDSTVWSKSFRSHVAREINWLRHYRNTL